MSEYPSHILKYDHQDGEKLQHPIAWCGYAIGVEWHFMDAQHFLLSAGHNAISACPACMEAIKRALNLELEEE